MKTSNLAYQRFNFHLGLFYHIVYVSRKRERYAVFSPWRWRQHGPPKRWYPDTTVHGITTQKTSTWIFIAVKISKLIWATITFLQLY